MTTIPQPAHGVWFDLESRTERVLDKEHVPDRNGFLWIDLELPAPEALADLVDSGVLPAAALGDEISAGDVRWTIELDHVQLHLAGARMHDESLILDRREIIVADRLVASLHRGCPRYFEQLRARYGGVFPSFARSHGFLLFEMTGHLVDDLQEAVRGLGDRIDALRLTGRPSAGSGVGEAGSELVSSVLLLRRILVRTRDLLSELASRRSAFVPETTQPYLRDIAGRLDGMVADLAFSRDVLDETLRDLDRREDVAGPSPDLAPAKVLPQDRPPLRFTTLGRFEIARGGEVVPEAALGAGASREFLAALLCSRRHVTTGELAGWLWPQLDGDSAERALSASLAEVRRALDHASDADGASSVILSDRSGYRLELGADDQWDVHDLLATPERAGAVLAPEERLAILSAALQRHQGGLCPEWPYSEWGRELRIECESAMNRIHGALAEALLQVGRPGEAAGHFELLLASEPESERWHRGLMRAYHDEGRHAVALRQYHACRSVLRQSRGVEPDAETQALYLELLRAG